MALKKNGQRTVRQPVSHLQVIVAKYSKNIQSTSVADSLKLDVEATKSD